MTDKKVTVLPDGPVARHTMRRGIPRLHPVNDGVVDMQAGLAMIQRRDPFGAKLVDVVDPTTGFCIYTRSPFYDLPNNGVGQNKPGVSGSHNSTTRQAMVEKVSGRYLDADGRVVRTTDMGDAPIPSVSRDVPSTHTKTRKGAGSVDRGPVSGRIKRPTNPFDYVLPSGTVITIPGGQTGRFKQIEIESYIRVVAENNGRTLPEKLQITRAMKMAALAGLKQARASVLKKHGITE